MGLLPKFMYKTKDILIIGFAIFAAFFGAGNLILPPLLGFNSGPDWWLVALGFLTSATIIPLFALLAHARLQGTMLDFGNKVSPIFSLIFCLCVYAIAISLPCPRTAAVTHEMAIQPFFGTSSILTSTIYFVLVFVFVTNRGRILELLGKYLTPLLGIILLAIIFIGILILSKVNQKPEYRLKTVRLTKVSMKCYIFSYNIDILLRNSLYTTGINLPFAQIKNKSRAFG